MWHLFANRKILKVFVPVIEPCFYKNRIFMYSKSTVTHNIWKSWICTNLFLAMLSVWHIQCCMFKTKTVVKSRNATCVSSKKHLRLIMHLIFELISRHCVFRNLLLFPKFSRPPHYLHSFVWGFQPTIYGARPRYCDLFSDMYALSPCFLGALKFTSVETGSHTHTNTYTQHGQHPFCLCKLCAMLWRKGMSKTLKALKIRQLSLLEISLLEIHLC